MKKMLIAAACLLALVACKQKGNDPVQEALLQQRDSLTRIIEQKDNEIDVLPSKSPEDDEPDEDK